MALRPQQHVFPILDIMVAEAVKDIEASGKKKISCRAGCSHCCHLLVEVSWPEAMEMAYWVLEQPENKQAELIERITANAEDAKALFLKSKKDARYIEPVLDDEAELSKKAYDRYFFDKKRPCPFLVEGCCSAYSVRPSSCRMHMVTSPPALCADDVKDDSDYVVPDRVEVLREEVGPINSALGNGQGWGHLGVMVEAALEQISAARK